MIKLLRPPKITVMRLQCQPDFKCFKVTVCSFLTVRGHYIPKYFAIFFCLSDNLLNGWPYWTKIAIAQGSTTTRQQNLQPQYLQQNIYADKHIKLSFISGCE